jgi:hypothetical protein
MCFKLIDNSVDLYVVHKTFLRFDKNVSFLLLPQTTNYDLVQLYPLAVFVATDEFIFKNKLLIERVGESMRLRETRMIFMQISSCDKVPLDHFFFIVR